MVGDDYVEPQLARPRYLVDGSYGAVHCDQQTRRASGKALDVLEPQPVAVLAAPGNEPLDVGSKVSQRTHEDRSRADAVNVVVAVNQDRRTCLDVAERELNGLINSLEL